MPRGLPAETGTGKEEGTFESSRSSLRGPVRGTLFRRLPVLDKFRLWVVGQFSFEGTKKVDRKVVKQEKAVRVRGRRHPG